MDALRRAIEDKQRAQRDSAAFGRLVLSKSEAAEAWVSVSTSSRST